MNYTEPTPDGPQAVEGTSEPIYISRFVHVLGTYRTTILLSLIAVVVSYAIIAIVLYLTAPAQRVTSQRFRLDFERASEGRYPNGARFSIADVVGTPILQRAFRANHLSGTMGFAELTQSVFILESNAASELLAAEFQSKLADPRLTPVDRERIQNEYELKRQSISKNEYSINLVRRDGLHAIPEPIVRKVLLDILDGWADFAVNQQQVLSYRISVLSPDILKPNAIELSDPIAAIEVLRGKTNRVIQNIKEIEGLPSGNLVRTPSDRISLPEVRLRLEEIIRFRLEPLVTRVKASGLITDPGATTRFIETQLAYDQRQLQSKLTEADTTRQAIALYEQRTVAEGPRAERASSATAERRAESGAGGNETVMPQLSDTFLDRLLALTDRAAEARYRQKLVDEYRQTVADTIPIQQAVTYDTQLLNQLRTLPPATSRTDAATVRAEIDTIRAEVSGLIEKSNELYKLISSNMTPSTQLFTLTSPPTTRTVRAISLTRLALYGILLVLISIPVIVVACLLHARIREEEAAEAHVAQHHAAAS
ncbi:MAG TPA: hypothetical protein VLV78_16085 [Thermoanaerobaculia bacterium]|nr:hypothetical protein [Thermoanaerobaculia bacterium]